MTIDIRADELEITPSLKEYIEMRLGEADKFLGKFGEGEDIHLQVEVARTTHHHLKGEVFYAEANLRFLGNNIRAEADGEDVRAAIDEVKNKLREEARKFKEIKEEE